TNSLISPSVMQLPYLCSVCPQLSILHYPLSILLERLRLLQQTIDGQQKPPAAMAVTDAVIGGEAGVDDRTNSDQAVQRHRTVDNLAEADQLHLGRIDHTEYAFDSLLAEIGHGDGAVGEFRAARMAGARPVDQV